jgi:hypothetical protein
VQELRADPLVEPHPLGDAVHVGAGAIAEVGDLVHEADLHGQERVRRALDHLGRRHVGHENRRLDEEQRPVDLAHDLGRALAGGADDHAVRTHEVADRRPLAQELGVRHDVDVDRPAGRQPDLLAEPLAGADRHGALGDDDFVAVEVRRDRRGGRGHLRQIGGAVHALGGADGEEDDLRSRARRSPCRS